MDVTLLIILTEMESNEPGVIAPNKQMTHVYPRLKEFLIIKVGVVVHPYLSGCFVPFESKCSPLRRVND